MLPARVGVPTEAVGVLVVLDRLLDMARTTLTVFTDAACSVIVARLEGEKDVLADVSSERRDDTSVSA